MASEVHFLGCTVSGNGIVPQSFRVDAIQSIEVPTTYEQLRQLMGMIGNYSRFELIFASVVSPLQDILTLYNKAP